MTTKLYSKELSSGRSIVIPRLAVSQVMLDLMRKYPKPEAPLQEVEIAGRKTVERNLAHPAYAGAIKSWENDIETKASEVIMRMVARVQNVPEEDKPQVAEMRDMLSDLVGNQSDQMIWLRYVACADDDDVKELMQAVRSHGEPTSAGVGALADGFRG